MSDSPAPVASIAPPVPPEDDEGFIGRAGRFAFGRSWRVTASAVVTAAIGLVAMKGAALGLPLAVVDVAAYFAAGGMIVMGRMAKDDKATGLPK